MNPNKNQLMKLWSTKIFLYILAFSILALNSCMETESSKMRKKLEKFISEFEVKIIPLNSQYNLAAYLASTTGKEEDYKKATNLEVLLSKIYSNKENFELLKTIKKSELITDPQLKRQLEILYNTFLIHQIDEQKQLEIIMLETEISKKYSTYRPIINEKEISDTQIEGILSQSTDTEELQKYWRASKKVGREIDEDMVKLVKMRNSVAEQLGFNTYYEMMLITSGQNPDELDNIFDELDISTRGPYTQLKDQIDEYLASRYKIPKEQLMPWHYQNRFFQEAPKIFDINYDNYYASKDVVGLDNEYYSSIGLDISKILEKSDLFEKAGKSQHNFSSDIDRMGDVRIIANLKNNQYSMYALLYESGVSSYYKFIDSKRPFILKQPPHPFVAEAIGTLFGNLSQNPDWLKNYVGISTEEYSKIQKISAHQLRLNKFVFSRWAQVMFRFERELYQNPNQDLNTLWWNLVENYQMIRRPKLRNEPDWATKVHLITNPCTYHNYMLGEMLAAQLNEYIVKNITNGKDISMKNKDIGNFFIEKIFEKGASDSWNSTIYKATGDSLSAEYFSRQFINL